MKTLFLAFSLLLALGSSLADEKTTPAAASGEPAGKQLFLDFVKQQRQKTWDFEDKMVQKNRQFQDEQLKSRRDAQIEDEATLSASTDLKAARKLVAARRKERMKAARTAETNHRKAIAQERKEFRAKMDTERKAFRQAHGAELFGDKPDRKKVDGKKKPSKG